MRMHADARARPGVRGELRGDADAAGGGVQPPVAAAELPVRGREERCCDVGCFAAPMQPPCSPHAAPCSPHAAPMQPHAAPCSPMHPPCSPHAAPCNLMQPHATPMQPHAPPMQPPCSPMQPPCNLMQPPCIPMQPPCNLMHPHACPHAASCSERWASVLTHHWWNATASAADLKPENSLEPSVAPGLALSRCMPKGNSFGTLAAMGSHTRGFRGWRAWFDMTWKGMRVTWVNTALS